MTLPSADVLAVQASASGTLREAIASALLVEQTLSAWPARLLLRWRRARYRAELTNNVMAWSSELKRWIELSDDRIATVRMFRQHLMTPLPVGLRGHGETLLKAFDRISQSAVRLQEQVPNLLMATAGNRQLAVAIAEYSEAFAVYRTRLAEERAEIEGLLEDIDDVSAAEASAGEETTPIERIRERHGLPS